MQDWLLAALDAHMPGVSAECRAAMRHHFTSLVAISSDKRALQRMLQEQVGIAKMGHRQKAAAAVEKLARWQPCNMLIEPRPAAKAKVFEQRENFTSDVGTEHAPTSVTKLKLRPLPHADCSTRDGLATALSLMRSGQAAVLKNSHLIKGADKWDLTFFSEQMKARIPGDSSAFLW